MATGILQAPFELVHKDYECRSAFDVSSPPSSPCSLYAVDSSPPSSPLHTFHLDSSDVEPDMIPIINANREYASPDSSPASIPRGTSKGKGKLPVELDASPAHPFSASTRAIKRPPSYSKDSARPKTKRQKNELGTHWGMSGMTRRVGIRERNGGTQSFVPSLLIPLDEEDESPEITTGKSIGSLVSPSQDPEHILWEETIAQAVDAAECKIDLSGHGLTYIPPKIADLSKLVVIPTALTREPGPQRSRSRSTNSIVFGAGKLGHREDEIHLFLGRNHITSLPNELFNLDALVVLSLRANGLTEIPPLICQLRNLRELNVANNKLRYLPSEIMSLKLNSLAVDPNPFEENSYARSEASKERWFGPIQRKHVVIPLVELTLRVLLAPSSELYGPHGSTLNVSGTKRQETILEHCYDLPVQSDCVKSPLLRETLSSCVPGSVTTAQSPHVMPPSPEPVQPSVAPVQRTCVSLCPSPKHLDVVGGKSRRPVFVAHAEERLSWEKHIAGQRVGGETGIPVRWRGCNAGCLEYLVEGDNNTCTVADGAEEDWSVGMDIDNLKGSNTTSDPTSVPLSTRNGFKTFDSADVDLDD